MKPFGFGVAGGVSKPDGAISNLVATVLSDTSIQLDFTNTNTNGDGVQVELSEDGGLTYNTTYSYPGSGVVQTTQIGLTQNTAYTWRARAYKGTSYTDYSNVVTATTYNTELITYIDGLSTPLSSGQQILLNTFIADLKAGLSVSNLSDAFDIMYILAGETQESSLKNIIKNTHHADAVGSPTFTAFEGFLGGTNKYIDTNYNPSTDGDKLLLNSCTIGTYTRTNLDEVTWDMGTTDTAKLYILSRLSNVFYYTNNCATDYGIANTSSLGMFVSSRTANNLTTAYKNKNALSTSSELSTEIPPVNMVVGARGRTATTEIYSNRQISFAFAGRGLSQTDVNILTDVFEVYMDAKGKGVIA